MPSKKCPKRSFRVRSHKRKNSKRVKSHCRKSVKRSSRKCKKGSRYVKSFKRSNGTKVKGFCARKRSNWSPRPVKRSPRRSYVKKNEVPLQCEAGKVYVRSFRRTNGTIVDGFCAKRNKAGIVNASPQVVQNVPAKQPVVVANPQQMKSVAPPAVVPPAVVPPPVVRAISVPQNIVDIQMEGEPGMEGIVRQGERSIIESINRGEGIEGSLSPAQRLFFF